MAMERGSIAAGMVVPMKKLLSVFLAVFVSFSLASCGEKAPPSSSSPKPNDSDVFGPALTASFGHVMAADSPAGKAADFFAERVSELTEGTVVVTVHPGSQLGGDRDMIESQQMGALEFSLPGTSIYSSFEPTLGTFCLPFLYSDYEEARAVLDSEEVASIYSVTENQNIKLLTTFESGFRQLGTNKRPVNSLADLKGQIIRIPQGDIYTQTWAALGTNGTPLTWNELFAALQTGVVDGEEAPLANFAATGFGEVCKYFAYINYAYDPLMFTVSNDFWNKMNPAQQDAVRQAALEARDKCRELNTQAEADYEAQLIEKWGTEFTHPDLTDFKAAVQPVYDGWDYQDTLKIIQDVQAKLG